MSFYELLQSTLGEHSTENVIIILIIILFYYNLFSLNPDRGTNTR